MPKSKLSKDRHDKLISVVWGGMQASSKNYKEVSKRTGMSTGTLTNRKSAPENFTLAELRSIRLTLGIPIDDIIDAVRKCL